MLHLASAQNHCKNSLATSAERKDRDDIVNQSPFHVNWLVDNQPIGSKELMEEFKPKTLENILKLKTVFKWLKEDASDDFYPDPFLFDDLVKAADEYLENRKYRIWQLDTLQHLCEYVPKKSGMLRTAYWLHPTHRILFLAILQHLIGKIDIKLSRSLYSYRAGNLEDHEAYPYPNRVESWKVFVNNFRETSLADTTKAVLITDLASYFDHICCEKLIQRIANLLGAGITNNDQLVLNLLGKLLRLWSVDGFGIPQNLDTSSFLGNLYLHNVDEEMSRKYKYFRYVDDIRIVADSEEEALLALHDLQRALARDKLFLASDKTQIMMVESEEFNELMNVRDDVILSDSEAIIRSGDCTRIAGIIEMLFSRLEFHSSKQGDERKFRAYLNKLLDIGDYEGLSEIVHNRLVPFVIPRLRSHPDRTDYWVRALAVHPDDKVSEALIDLLVVRPTVFDWQKFYLWKLALYLPSPPQELINKAIETCVNHESENVAAQAAIFIGKHGTNTTRENLFKNFTNRRGYVVQRAVLIALQELPNRLSFYRQALDKVSDHSELISYLTNLQKPIYGEKYRSIRQCKEVPLEIEAFIKQGVGLVNGEKTEFRLLFDDFEIY